MVKMAGQQQRPCRYPSLLVTVKRETNERLVTETYSKPQIRRSKDNYRPTFMHPKTIYYNSNHRQEQFTRAPPRIARHSKNDNRFYYPNQYQPIRPLMEIPNNHFSLHDNDDDDIPSRPIKQQQEPKQRGQYRNRKAELDWDHAFDLDQIDLYTIQNDTDNYSLTSVNSSSDNSFSSV